MTTEIFPPSREADLKAWATNFTAKIIAGPASYGLSEPQATAFAVLASAYVAAYDATVNPNTNTRANTVTKNETKAALLDGANGAWELVDIVQAFPGTTDGARAELGLRIPDASPTPVPQPSSAPDLSIVTTTGRLIIVRLRDQANPDKRGKPAGTAGATVLYFVGEEAPTDLADWKFAMSTSKVSFSFDIPPSIAAGAKIWLTAFWFNARQEQGPTALPESTRAGEGTSMAA